jgi:hypothetical protein
LHARNHIPRAAAALRKKRVAFFLLGLEGPDAATGVDLAVLGLPPAAGTVVPTGVADSLRTCRGRVDATSPARSSRSLKRKCTRSARCRTKVA